MAFDHPTDMARIAGTVLRVDAFDQSTPHPARRRRLAPGTSGEKGVLGFPTADVNAGASHTFDLAQTPEGAPIVWDAGVETKLAYNITGRRIRSGILCTLNPFSLEGAAGLVWYARPIDQHAQFVRGVASSAINAGASGTISSVVGIDGIAENTSLTVVSVTAIFDVPNGAVVWAHWATERDQYEIYQSDCPM